MSLQIFYKIFSSDCLTPTIVLKKLHDQKERFHFYESAEKHGSKNCHSIFAFNPIYDFTARNGECHSNLKGDLLPKKELECSGNGDVIEKIRKIFTEFDRLIPRNHEYQNKIASSLFCYYAYDFVKYTDNIDFSSQKDELNIPDCNLTFYKNCVIFDHFNDSICITEIGDNEGLALDSIEDIAKDIFGDMREDCQRNIELPKKRASDFDLDAFKHQYTREEYYKMVEKSQEYIAAGDVFQILPSQRLSKDFDENNIVSFYRALRNVNPSPFLFFIKQPDFYIIGSSPEIMVRVNDEKVTIRPLAGTRAIAATDSENEKIAEELLNDPKEISEHLMLLDLGRNDVGKVCEFGSVNVTERMIVERYSHVMHISSNVEGKIRKECDALDAFASSMPAGTVCGAPKIRAMQILAGIEKISRGFYAGSCGFASLHEAELCIMLRTSLVKDNKIYLQAGGGVVMESTPEGEYNEAINKMKAVIRALDVMERFI